MRTIFTALLLAFAFTGPVVAAPKGCPPGLAKKNPPCVPPGQAKKYGIGDRIDGKYDRVPYPERYGLDRNETYYRVGNYVYRINRDTKEVLDLIGAIGAVLD